MNDRWEYKVITLKHGSGPFKLTETLDDFETTVALDHEGSRDWELVNASCVGPVQLAMLHFKRPR